MATKERVCLEAPNHAWDTIDETISLDMRSSAFESSLRDQIERDWNRLRVRRGVEKVHVEGPSEAWDGILETLAMDANSSMFDKALQDEIRDAWERVETVPCRPRKRR
jgi:hypothetical protein